MSGGEVSGNIISGLHPGHGGGVYVSSGTFVMSGGEVSGNIISDIAGYGYGREVAVDGTFKLSGDARPERVFLYADHYIAIAGPLSGGTVSVDLGSVTDWVGQRILLNYPSGDMASLKTHFTLGNYSSHETPIPTGPGGYKLDNGGYFVAY
jgi:hypothetical protein